jgi:hypothetical protein
MKDSEKYYVYTHCDSTGTPFYVGKGSTWRAYEFNKRSLYYKIYVKGLGGIDAISVKFHRTNLSEDVAYLHERVLIRTLRSQGVFLVNMDNGGRKYLHSKKQRRLFERAQMAVLHKEFSVSATCVFLKVPEGCEETAWKLGAFWSDTLKTWGFSKKKQMSKELAKWL